MKSPPTPQPFTSRPQWGVSAGWAMLQTVELNTKLTARIALKFQPAFSPIQL